MGHFTITLNAIIFSVANGIYQNTVYGVAAKLPFKYIGAVVLGSVSLIVLYFQKYFSMHKKTKSQFYSWLTTAQRYSGLPLTAP